MRVKRKAFRLLLSLIFLCSLLFSGVSLVAADELIDLQQYRGQNGVVLSFTVRGTLEGNVWGNDIYTDDSDLATAAVHAGLLNKNETKTLQIMILPGQSSYQGSVRNGVESQSYDEWDGSFKFVGSNVVTVPETTLNANDISLQDYRGQNGTIINVIVTGKAAGTVWGSGIYTDDSDISVAAVHAGVVGIGETKKIRITILPGQNSYQGTTRKGITTQPYDEWDGSFKFTDIALPLAPETTPPQTTIPGENKFEVFGSGVIISWYNKGVIGYRIFRSTSESELGISVTDFYLTNTRYVDVNVESNTTYYYSVRPVLGEAKPMQGIEERLGDVIARYVITTGGGISNPGKQRNFISLQLNNPMMSVNGIAQEVDPGRGTAPIVISGRSMIPIRAVVEAMGGTLQWDNATQKITLTARGNVVEMWVGKKDVTVNGASRKMDVAPVSQNGRTYVPVRFAAENLNSKVDWINSTSEAIISY